MCQNCANQETQAKAQTADIRERLRIQPGLSVIDAFKAQTKERAMAQGTLSEKEAEGVADRVVTQALGAVAQNHDISALTVPVGQLSVNAKHSPVEPSIVYLGNDHVAIKPFSTLDDAVITGEKVGHLIYPEDLGERQIEKFEADLLRAASTLAILPAERKFEGLTAVLAIVLMGFESEDLDEVKNLLRVSLEKAAAAEVRKNTSAFLEEKGFASA